VPCRWWLFVPSEYESCKVETRGSAVRSVERTNHMPRNMVIGKPMCLKDPPLNIYPLSSDVGGEGECLAATTQRFPRTVWGSALLGGGGDQESGKLREWLPHACKSQRGSACVV
jgi:hypothetical protein